MDGLVDEREDRERMETKKDVSKYARPHMLTFANNNYNSSHTHTYVHMLVIFAAWTAFLSIALNISSDFAIDKMWTKKSNMQYAPYFMEVFPLPCTIK